MQTLHGRKKLKQERRDVMEKDQREEVEGGQSHSSISTQYINVGIGTNVC